MTPAEHARLIEQQELEAERTAIRERALRLVEQRRQEDRRKVENWIGKPQPAPSSRRPPSCSRPSKRYMLNGEAKTMTELTQIAGVSASTLKRRLASGMSIEDAVTMRARNHTRFYEINGVSKSLKQWADHIGIACEALIGRTRRGRTLAEAVAMGGPIPRGRKARRGVSSDFVPFEGTGAGSTLQAIPEITFSEQAENR
ncbi:MAG: hypothetical protein WBA42_01785 [Mesorhizobium sp.]